MKTALSLLLAAALAFPGLSMLSGSVSAQDDARRGRAGAVPVAAPAARGRSQAEHRRHAPDADARVARTTEALQLDAAQAARLREIVDDARAERAALREQPRSAETREARRAIVMRMRERIQALLTPAQRAELEQQRGEHGQRRARPEAAEPPEPGARHGRAVRRGPVASDEARGVRRGPPVSTQPRGAAKAGARHGA